MSVQAQRLKKAFAHAIQKQTTYGVEAEARLDALVIALHGKLTGAKVVRSKVEHYHSGYLSCVVHLSLSGNESAIPLLVRKESGGWTAKIGEPDNDNETKAFGIDDASAAADTVIDLLVESIEGAFDSWYRNHARAPVGFSTVR